MTNQWVSISKQMPPKPGLYFVLAESSDPEKPLFCTAWYEDGWSLMIPAFIPAITHWMQPARPDEPELKKEIPLQDFIEIISEPVEIQPWMRQYIIDALTDMQQRRSVEPPASRDADIEDVMRGLYASELNFSVSCFWDAGYDVKLGDHLNGFKAAFTALTLDEIAQGLTEAACKHYPDSQFAAQVNRPVAQDPRNANLTADEVAQGYSWPSNPPPPRTT